MTDRTFNPFERDADLINAEIALKRAVKSVREQARRAGLELVYLEDGEIKVQVPPDEPDEESTMDVGQER